MRDEDSSCSCLIVISMRQKLWESVVISEKAKLLANIMHNL